MAYAALMQLRQRNKNLTLVVIGTKIDLVHLQKCKLDEITMNLKATKIKFIEVSALNSHNVIKAFNIMMSKISRKLEAKLDKKENI